MKGPIYIGLIGFGTVGSGVVKVLQDNADLIEKRVGQPIKIKKIADKDLARPRIVSVEPGLLTTDVNQVLNDPEVSIIVEAIGGIEPAKKIILEAIGKGKHVVTPNKEVIAKHGEEIFKAAEKMQVSVLFEGSVGGGIPIIRPLRICLAANRIKEVHGIVNGTTNYILSKMHIEGRDFEEVLAEAKTKGYTEADPSSDIDGYDAAYKAAILAAVAFGAKVKLEDVYFEGIRKINQKDISYAKEMGYLIKLLAIAKETREGLEIRVHPTLIPQEHPLASVSGAFNAIYVKGDAVGEVMFYGEGAGALPTGSAVVGDIIEIAKKGFIPPLHFEEKKVRKIGEISGKYYIRIQAPDKVGVLAAISSVFAEKKVSIAAVAQKETVGQVAHIVIITHITQEKAIQEALSKMKGLPEVLEISNVIRVGLES